MQQSLRDFSSFIRFAGELKSHWSGHEAGTTCPLIAYQMAHHSLAAIAVALGTAARTSSASHF